MLTQISEKTVVFYSNRNRWFADYRCHCGTVKSLPVENVERGLSKSCGCEGSRSTMGERSRKYDLVGKEREYQAWREAKRRCLSRSRPCWGNYGGRGITMCAEWLKDFNAFYTHIGPSNGLTLDRINNDAGYEPGNVRWATRKEQANNRRKRRWRNKPEDAI